MTTTAQVLRRIADLMEERDDVGCHVSVYANTAAAVLAAIDDDRVIPARHGLDIAGTSITVHPVGTAPFHTVGATEADVRRIFTEAAA